MARLSYADLERHKLTTIARFDAAVGKAMMSTAGISGRVTEALVEQARVALQNEIEETEALPSIIDSAGTAVAEQMRVYRQTKSLGKAVVAETIAVPLAKGKDEQLEIRQVDAPQFVPASNYGGRYTPARNVMAKRDQIMIIDASNPAGRKATVADLHRFQINNAADLTSAAGDAILSIADEDLPRLKSN
jgi:hypothetical protein